MLLSSVQDEQIISAAANFGLTHDGQGALLATMRRIAAVGAPPAGTAALLHKAIPAALGDVGEYRIRAEEKSQFFDAVVHRVGEDLIQHCYTDPAAKLTAYSAYMDLEFDRLIATPVAFMLPFTEREQGLLRRLATAMQMTEGFSNAAKAVVFKPMLVTVLKGARCSPQVFASNVFEAVEGSINRIEALPSMRPSRMVLLRAEAHALVSQTIGALAPTRTSGVAIAIAYDAADLARVMDEGGNFHPLGDRASNHLRSIIRSLDAVTVPAVNTPGSKASISETAIAAISRPLANALATRYSLSPGETGHELAAAVHLGLADLAHSGASKHEVAQYRQAISEHLPDALRPLFKGMDAVDMSIGYQMENERLTSASALAPGAEIG